MCYLDIAIGTCSKSSSDIKRNIKIDQNSCRNLAVRGLIVFVCSSVCGYQVTAEDFSTSCPRLNAYNLIHRSLLIFTLKFKGKMMCRNCTTTDISSIRVRSAEHFQSTETTVNAQKLNFTKATLL